MHRKEWDDPYFVALFDIVTLLTEIHTKNRIRRIVDGPLDFIFDDNARLAAKVPKWYQYMRSVMHPLCRNSIGFSPRFENDQEFLPLQAADAQSWYYRRLFAEKFHNEPFKKDLPRDIFRPLDNVQAAMSFWGSERMEYVASHSLDGRTAVEQNSDKHFRDIHDLIANADMR
jgi:hypothetical protein